VLRVRSSPSDVPRIFFSLIACCTLYPTAELTAESDRVTSSLNRSLTTAGVIVLVVLIGVIIALIYVMRRVSMHYTAPLADFTRVLTDLNQSNVNSELGFLADGAGAQGAGSSELDVMGAQFKNLLVAVRFGNAAYAAGTFLRLSRVVFTWLAHLGVPGWF
jgi:hypothetical protein